MTPVFKAIDSLKSAHRAWVAGFPEFNDLEKKHGISSPEADRKENINDRRYEAYHAALHSLAETPSRDPSEFAAKMGFISDCEPDFGSLTQATAEALRTDARQCAAMRVKTYLPNMAGLSILDLCGLLVGFSTACDSLPADREDASDFAIVVINAIEDELFARIPANADEALHQLMMFGDAIPEMYPVHGSPVVGNAIKLLKHEYLHGEKV